MDTDQLTFIDHLCLEMNCLLGKSVNSNANLNVYYAIIQKKRPFT